MELLALFDLAAQREASDIHLATGEAPRLRIKGDLVALDEPLDVTALLEPVLTAEGRARLGVGMPYERSIVHGGFAYHGIVFQAEDGLAATFRILHKGVPPFERIMEGAEAFFGVLAGSRRGLILVSGPVGSGKTTTALALVDRINAARAARIFVVSDGPSHVFENRRGLVSHLRVDEERRDYGRALRIAGQASADVVTTDDLPTYEDLRQALLLAESGVLVVANLHAFSPAQAVERLLDSADEEAPALRRALAENLVAVAGQRLLPRAGGGRLPAYEWIANSEIFKAALLAGDDLTTIQREDPESRTMEAALENLVAAGE